MCQWNNARPAVPDQRTGSRQFGVRRGLTSVREADSTAGEIGAFAVSEEEVGATWPGS